MSLPEKIESAEPLEVKVFLERYRARLEGLEKANPQALEQTIVECSEDGVRVTKQVTLGRATEPTNRSAEEIENLARARGIAWVPELASRDVAYWASDERVDSHGDIVRQSWVFDTWKSNPVMPFSHGWSGLPVANGIDEKVLTRKDQGYTGPALWILGLFVTRDMWDWADTVFRMVKSGFLRGGSVGFKPGRIIDVKDDKERERLGLGRWGYVLEDNELLEFSPTLIPANAGARTILANSKSKGLLEPQDFDCIREICRTQYKSKKDTWRDQDTSIVAMARVLFPHHEFPKHEDIEQPFEVAEPRKLSKVVSIRREDAPSIDERVEHLQALCEESFQGLSIIANDMRSEIEEVKRFLETLTTRARDAPKEAVKSDEIRAIDEQLSKLKSRLSKIQTV